MMDGMMNMMGGMGWAMGLIGLLVVMLLILGIAGLVVRDANDQAIAYVYSRSDESEARQAKVLTADEARRIALNIARLPEYSNARPALHASPFELAPC